MEKNHQNLCDEAKVCDVASRQEDVNYPCCPLHKADANLVSKNEEG